MNRANVATVFLASAAVAALFFVYRDRPIVVPSEGAESMRAAASLLDHGALESLPREPYANFGLLLPVLLAGLAVIGFGPLDAFVLINSVVLVASFVIFAALARRVSGRSARLAVPLFCALAVHEYYFRQARLDALVSASGMLAILSVSSYAERFRRRDLVTAAVACAVATTVRYMGVVPMAPISLYVAHAISRRPERGRMLDALLFFGIGWGPIAAWLVRNVVVTGYVTGMSRTEWRSQSAGNGLGTHLAAIAKAPLFDFFGVRTMGVADVLSGATSPPHLSATWTLFVFAAISGLAALLVARRARSRAPTSTPDCVLDSSISRRSTRLVATWFAAYSVGLLALWTLANNDPLQTRYIAPCYGFAMLLAFRGVERLRSAPRSLAPALLLAALLAILVPNVDKALRLLGNSPEEALIRTRPYRMPDPWIPRGKDLWIESLTWEQVAAGPPP